VVQDRTISVTPQPDGEPGDGARNVPQLVFLARCDATETPSQRHLLEGIDEVLIGRGDPSIRRRNGVLALDVPDTRMSRRHARIACSRGGWILEDQESKNRTLVNGAPAGKKTLDDGDVIECGHSFFLFRDAVPAVFPDRVDLVDEELPAPTPSLRTFVASFADMLAPLAALAASSIPITIRGETGTGKEVVARAVHELSGRSGRFLGLNCGALAPSIVEAELFGHRRGAFTGAVHDRLGLIRQADKGTLLLDEIGELPPPAQATLLRVLQERELIPLGGSGPVAVDLRLVCATHRDLEALVTAQIFRNDLYARLTGATLRLPPLCERREDFGLLLGSLLARRGLRGKLAFSSAAMRLLIAHDWPLNVRELERCLEVVAAIAGGRPVQPADLPQGLRVTPSTRLTDEERQHRDQLVELFRRHDGSVAAVARALNKARMQIHRWAKRYGIAIDSFRRRDS